MRLVAPVSHSDGDQARGNVGGDRIELRHSVGPAQVLEDGRHENRKALHGDVDEEEAQGAGVVVDAEDGLSDVLPRNGSRRICLVLADEPLHGDAPLPLRQEVGTAGARGHPNRGRQANDHGYQSFKKEDVPPRVNSHRADTPFRNPCKTGRQQTAKRAGDGRGRDVDAHAKEQLVPLVKAAEEEGHPGHSTALEDAQEHAGDHQALKVDRKRSADGHQPKAADQEREVKAPSDAFQENVAGHLDKQVDDVENGERPVETDTLVEVEVDGEALDARIPDVDAVQEGEHVEESHEGHRVPVDLAANGRLFLLGPLELRVGPAEVGEVAILGRVDAGLLNLPSWEESVLSSGGYGDPVWRQD